MRDRARVGQDRVLPTVEQRADPDPLLRHRGAQQLGQLLAVGFRKHLGFGQPTLVAVQQRK
ncbi:hypothetical protein BBK82_37495 [Lentzea guizhouensis]|uniref:Uncharacterized protein n=1 Tax=Lentzea guizhouensis TaxID=1586287 RepID=A0A1B2HSY7_9PSEU|nr:hypothetical protein BBK82_37495 [Lentzea guizhouensis]